MAIKFLLKTWFYYVEFPFVFDLELFYMFIHLGIFMYICELYMWGMYVIQVNVQVYVPVFRNGEAREGQVHSCDVLSLISLKEGFLLTAYCVENHDMQNVNHICFVLSTAGWGTSRQQHRVQKESMVSACTRTSLPEGVGFGKRCSHIHLIVFIFILCSSGFF